MEPSLLGPLDGVTLCPQIMNRDHLIMEAEQTSKILCFFNEYETMCQFSGVYLSKVDKESMFCAK